MEKSRIFDAVPDALSAGLRRLGEDISAARRARRISQRQMAEKLNVGQPSIVRMEKGDPKVAFGVYAMAAWVMGIEKALLSSFAPEADPVVQREARLSLPKRIRSEAESSGMGDLDF